MYDHGILKRILLCYREISNRLAVGSPVLASDVTAGAQLIRDFIEGYHEGLEEEFVFPALIKLGKHSDIVAVLLAQHDRGRHITANVLDIAAESTTSPKATISPRATDSLRRQLDNFVRMYEPHEAWEDTLIFPAFRETVSDRIWRLLAERFTEEQRRQFGNDARQRLLDQVNSIETSLDLADLSKFTPQETS